MPHGSRRAWPAIGALLPLACLGGCGLVLDVGAADMESLDGGRLDSSVGRDGATRDAGPGDDGSVVPDAGSADGAPPDATIDAGTAAGLAVLFVTYATHAGDFGGVALADGICRAAATEAGIAYPVYALVSDSRVEARDRVPAGVPIVDTAGNDIALDKADLFDGTVIEPIASDQFGSPVLPGVVWTGSDPDGTRDEFDFCGDWTLSTRADSAEIGRNDRSDQGWISVSHPERPFTACGAAAHIYCIIAVP